MQGMAPGLSGVRSAFLVGVEGVGMSGAARLLRARGVAVAGSDRTPGERSAALRGLGVRVEAGENPAALPPDLDLLIHSAAVPANHPQVREAVRRGVRVWKYGQAVGALMEGRTGICVAGCHGKTTTTSLIASALLAAQRDPSFVIGGTLRETGSGARAGAGAHFVVESCEYDRTFHAHRPTIAVVTNVDEDHLDYYRDLAEIQESFRVFAARLPADGVLVVNEAYAHLFRGDPRIRARIETFGFGESAHQAEEHWRAGEPWLDPEGGGIAFEVTRDGKVVGRLSLPLLGSHNALNALAAAAALTAAGLPWWEIAAGLARFQGVGRRLETVADKGGVLLLDDYGHHPAEIRAVVRALRARHPGRRLIVAFQPHQASRTRCLLDDFATALAGADEAWLPPIYFARDSEEERRAVTSEDLAARVRNEGGRAATFPDLAALVEHAAANVRAGDVVVTMGAGDIDEAARGLSARL
jgi:UDP-N-acetylmuramate--alanine ligase